MHENTNAGLACGVPKTKGVKSFILTHPAKCKQCLTWQKVGEITWKKKMGKGRGFYCSQNCYTDRRREISSGMASSRGRMRKIAKSKKGKSFYDSGEWKVLRYEFLKSQRGACQACGRGAKDGLVMHVDHVKPLAHYPELSLDKNNLQLLCSDCNLGKGAWDATDWRAKNV